MLRPLHGVVLGLMILVAGWGMTPSASADTITIGAYNVENFFDVFDDPYTGDEGVRVKSRRDIATMAKALKKLDADVVVFQELENEHLLQAMVDEFLPNEGYEYIAAQRTNSGRGINLGVISRFPIKELRSYRFTTLTNPKAPGREWKFARDVMRVTIDAGLDRPIEVFSIHLKSNRDGPDDPNSRLYRTAEAIALKKIIQEEVDKDPGFLAVLGGDFNSNYETRPEQPRPWPAMEHLLATEPGDDPLLIDVHADLSDKERVTIPGSGRYPPATFDYILVTPAMAERYVKGSATVIRSESLTSGSDHRPLSAEFRLD
ncbi:endonuclease/exonuclease/phosphatase family protein [Algisphaera agarilytica]|uniref:Endonuclease/exonuclease/phosphatase family metal-dependent hydrolase n=1 Tax=Algisphaera agarilytica TaxID=1385975 RepID=A0A7X0H981_9BACT|nr:endonuclease/exonuclease/phosphatase family protein [Algisphaera agarilytica]MBB6431443.1 endonuclease/exonuclease/phosphatase family metal-dependent hydrolase [Algisphaera agarilytica]